MRDGFIDRHFFWIIAALALISVVALIWVVNSEREEYEAFMKQCVEDGRKEYECKSMWWKPGL